MERDNMSINRQSYARRGRLPLSAFLLAMLLTMSLSIWIGVGRAFAAPAAPAGKATTQVDFTRDIWPILQARCVECHGPEKQKAKLRLDSRDILLNQGGVSGAALHPGQADKSLLYLRVAGLLDGEDLMPPKGDPLTKEQVAFIRQWIDEGANWPKDIGVKNATLAQHWAYVKPQRPALPKVKDANWPRNAIDYFVLAKLEAAGLKPSPQADKARLIRRVYLDLLGLPPTPAQVDAFLADPRVDAYERVVDQLLASPRYGEHWARHWLDLARYADSNGFQRDGHREVWAYRDWVIKAFNDDLPFDQFTIAQLAGDLLAERAEGQGPGAKGQGANINPRSAIRNPQSSSPLALGPWPSPLDLHIATGFHRGTTVNVEAGTDPEEDRIKQVVDRVNTTATVFLGSTLACAQCHNHKYDPFSQKEYYQLLAYFNNTAVESERRGPATLEFVGPSMSLPLMDVGSAKRQALAKRLETCEAELDGIKSDVDHRIAAWEKQLAEAKKEGKPQQPTWHALDVADFNSSGGAEGTILEDKSVLVSGARPDTDVYTVTVETELTDITGFKLEALTDDSLPGKGPGRHHQERPNFVLYEFTITASPSDKAGGKKTKPQPVALTDAQADFSQEKWSVKGLIDGDPKTGWAINPEFHKPHHATFKTAKPAGFKGGTTLTFTLDQHYGECRTIGRLRLSALTGGAGPALPAEITRILDTPAATRVDAQKDKLREYFLKQDVAAQKLETEASSLKKQIEAMPAPSTLVMKELDQPRETHVMKRGDFLQLGERVIAATPSVLHAMPEAAPRDRLGLAQWIASNDNPLLARVTVNRWWAEFFGQGIVTTLEDFGTQGDLPTHPQLLDWLAIEFMSYSPPSQGGAGGGSVAQTSETKSQPWSMKHLHRLIVTSATYRQSSRITPDLLQRDPTNTLLTRGPRFRLQAETIRDNALAIAGLLSDKMFGPPVYPPQPDGLWRVTGKVDNTYRTSQGEDRYRRGIYTVLRRSAPYPSFLAFDATDRGECTVKRPRTNTALAALTLLNDPVYVECAVTLAQRMLTNDPKMTVAQRAEYGMRLCVSRKPSPREIEIITAMYHDELARLKKDANVAKAILKDVKVPAGVDANELAAWFFVANALLNLDETITKG
ncbi:MAG: PSD1 and planctomycete cytochrome C domain-containing protein [Phycisphaeraceae bacterium]